MSNLNDKAIAALQQPDTNAIPIEMTPELKAKISRVSDLIIDLLRANTRGPMEAYMVLHFVMTSLEETCGIRGGFSVDKRDQEH